MHGESRGIIQKQKKYQAIQALKAPERGGGRAVLLCGAFPGRYRKAAGNESWKCAGHAAPCETETKEPITGLIKKVGL